MCTLVNDYDLYVTKVLHINRSLCSNNTLVIGSDLFLGFGELTKNWILFMLKVLELRMWSASRPGVATTTCGWLDSSRAWVTISAHNTAESAQSTSIRQKQTKFMETSDIVWFLQLSIITFWGGPPPLKVSCKFCTGGLNSLKAQKKQVNLAHFYTLIKGQLLNY